MRLTVEVNGAEHTADDVWPGESLLYVLRERMGLPGTKNACEQGECGSCSVYLDGTLVCACLVAAGQAQGRSVRTVEGLAESSAALDPVQQAFVHAGPDHRHPRPARPPSRAERPGDPRGPRRQPVPVHRLREDPGRGALGRNAEGRPMTTRPLSGRFRVEWTVIS
jgi:hypothetical protein